MSIRHNCGKEKDLELSWVDPTGNTPDRIKCNICGREFVDIICINRLKEEMDLWVANPNDDFPAPPHVELEDIIKIIDKIFGEKLRK